MKHYRALAQIFRGAQVANRYWFQRAPCIWTLRYWITVAI